MTLNLTDDPRNLAGYVDKFKAEGSPAWEELSATDREEMLADYERVIVEIAEHLRENHTDLTSSCRETEEEGHANFTSAKAALVAQHCDSKIHAAAVGFALEIMDQRAKERAALQMFVGAFVGSPPDPDSDEGLRAATEGQRPS